MEHGFLDKYSGIDSPVRVVCRAGYTEPGVGSSEVNGRRRERPRHEYEVKEVNGNCPGFAPFGCAKTGVDAPAKRNDEGYPESAQDLVDALAEGKAKVLVE